MRIESYSHNGTDDDRMYEVIKAWSPDDFPDPWLLPKLGVIAFDDLGVPVAFLAADMSNSIPRAMLECLQTNPDYSPIERFRAVKIVEEFICLELKELGYDFIVGISKLAGVACLAQKLDYWVLPKGLTYFHKSLA